MCGICGIVDFDGPALPPETVQRMSQTLSHRGPDAQGYFVSGPAALGHARLSVIDLSDKARQPMLSADGKVALVCNGEIYNFQEIRDRLSKLGASFNSRSDSEVALQAYLHWGTDAVEQFKGMFALAIWDGRDEKLLLARDRFGIKPLYYLLLDSGIVFGSEVKAMLASERLRPGLDWHALHEYLYYGTALGGRSFFEGVQKLLPGCVLQLDRTGHSVGPFASVFNLPATDDDFETASTKVRELLVNAVDRHLVSDVPVGVFLSGGIDSSAITAIAAQRYRQKLHTFSVGFDFQDGANELPKARLVAERFGTQHHELFIEARSLPDIIERLVRCHDEPFSDPANIPLYLLCEQLRGSIKVILQGDGGDEIFAGYHRYIRLAWEKPLRQLGRAALWFRPLLRNSQFAHRGLKGFFSLSHPDASARMAWLMSQEHPDSLPERVFSQDARRRLQESDPFARYRQFYHRFEHLDPVQRMLYTDTGVILADLYFEKVDKATMAHGIEVRVPFVDNDLASYVMSLPAALKIRGMRKKALLRRALRDLLPKQILDGPKTGFGVPFQAWLKGPLAGYMRETLLDPSLRQWGLFDLTALQTCIDDHISGRRQNGFLLNKLVNLAIWRRSYLR